MEADLLEELRPKAFGVASSRGVGPGLTGDCRFPCKAPLLVQSGYFAANYSGCWGFKDASPAHAIAGESTGADLLRAVSGHDPDRL